MGIMLQKIDRPMGNDREIVKIQNLNNCIPLRLYIKTFNEKERQLSSFQNWTIK